MIRLLAGCATIAAGLMLAPAAQAWELSGDFRTHIYTQNWRDTRDGFSESSSASGARLRLRLRHGITDSCRFQTRLAATALDSGNDFDFYVRGHRDSGTEVNPGTATFDEFFVQCSSGDGASEWRLGRMQSNLDSIQMATRSFDRSQASALNIGWTDAIAYRRNFANGWYGEGLLQYNSRDGNGQTFRGPIRFDDSDARIGFFGVLGSDAEVGPWMMRALSLTVYPDALAPAGFQSAERDDYVMIALKLGAGWDLGDTGRRLIAIGEIAHAPNTPLNATLGLPGNGNADGWGWQLGADLENVIPRNTVGLNYGQSDGGMLISNDFRQNNELFEFRWQYQVTSALRFEFRYRWRRELEKRIGASLLQRDRDVRLRATYRF
ncbi:MAG: hypothetical protein V2J10_08435 [Wenzhouxiangella sp.]|jgi:hypothetical protein|nr:hypothetical protein [Wenzhouxiangella sp.]